MKFFLIVFLFDTHNAMMWEKNIIEVEDKLSCQVLMDMYKAPEGFAVEKYCVSQDHYLGYSQDEGVPYDMDGEDLDEEDQSPEADSKQK